MHPIYNLLEQDKPKDEIFHYTTQIGFLGILDSESIWASQICCLNDSSEFKLAIDIAKKLLKGRKDKDERLFSSLFDMIETQIPDIFVCSFSEKPDLLSQWRAYGNTSGGLSIGFITSALIEQAEKQDFILAKCVYKPEEQFGLINRAIDDFFDNQVNNLPGFLKEYYNMDPEAALKIALFVYLMNFAPIIKDEGFQEEAEWRLISATRLTFEQISFRSGNSFLIPYFQFKLGDLNNIINKIIIGPTPHEIIAKNSVEMLLKKSSYAFSDNVETTKIPYRNW